MSACECDTRDPIESEDYTLYRCPHCPDCGVVGSYQGAGSTSISNWRGRPYSRYYCPDCGTRYKVYAMKRETPTM
jgi:predicted RNA-binding Zn-ribbon protein involved in translation (DUF1610 family)